VWRNGTGMPGEELHRLFGLHGLIMGTLITVMCFGVIHGFIGILEKM
jgi:hypothetical protein